jgi:phosphoglycerate dehydrogenase-like enzyme
VARARTALGAAAVRPGLDVYGREPADPDAALIRHPRVLATPYAGWLTSSMFQKAGTAFGASLQRWADGAAPCWPVNSPAFCRSPARA